MISQNKTKNTSVIMNIYLFQTCFFIADSNNRENMKSDLWGLDLLTPVFHYGNHSSNCFWGVPDPFTLHSAFQRQKHGLYLTHVLFSSPFMCEQSLQWCLFGVDVAFEFKTLRKGGIDLKDSIVLYLLSGAFIARSTHSNKNIFTNTIFFFSTHHFKDLINFQKSFHHKRIIIKKWSIPPVELEHPLF